MDKVFNAFQLKLDSNPITSVLHVRFRYYILVSLTIYFFRSMPQLLNPQLWAEDLTMLKVVENGEMFSSLGAMSGQAIWVSYIRVFLGSYNLLLVPQMLLLSSIATYLLTLWVFLRIESTILMKKLRNYSF